MDQIKIGEFIARKRKEQELTQMQFAELVGVSNKTVSKWETGARMPDVEIMQDVCDALRVTVNEFPGRGRIYRDRVPEEKRR